MTAVQTKPKCSWCGDPLDAEEAENPRKDPHGDLICDECYHDHFEFTCSQCEEGEDIEHQGAIGSVTVVYEEVSGLGEKVKPGVYRITKWPYYADGVTECYLIENALTRITDVPEGWTNADGCPCGHLCRTCQALLLKE